MSVQDEFEVTFDGRPFVRPTSAIEKHCEIYFDTCLPDLFRFPDPMYFAGGLLPANNPIPVSPRPKLNRWFYPYGMMRTSWFIGLMTGRDVAALNTTMFPGTSVVSKTFKVSAYGRTYETPMTMLPPFKLADVLSDSETIYLVVLVDERHVRRNERFASNAERPTQTVPGYATTETVPSAYSGLGFAEAAGTLAAGLENQSVIAKLAHYDHAATCLGMVYVRQFSGSTRYYRTRWKTANQLCVTDKVGAGASTVDYPAVAGHAAIGFTETPVLSSRAIFPGSVWVGFPAVTGTNTAAGVNTAGKPSWHWKTVTAPVGWAVGEFPAYVTTRKLATYAAAPTVGGPAPTNDATLTTIANQIGEDYYHALNGPADLVYTGLAYLDPRWACDFTVDFGETITTKIQRSAFNRREAVDLLIGEDLKVGSATYLARFYQYDNSAFSITNETSRVLTDGDGLSRLGGIRIKANEILRGVATGYFKAPVDGVYDGTLLFATWASGDGAGLPILPNAQGASFGSNAVNGTRWVEGDANIKIPYIIELSFLIVNSSGFDRDVYFKMTDRNRNWIWSGVPDVRQGGMSMIYTVG